VSVGDRRGDLAQFVAELPVIATGDEEILIDESDDDKAKREGRQYSRDEVITVAGSGSVGPSPLTGFYAGIGELLIGELINDLWRSVPPFPTDQLRSEFFGT
jgi:hypothetical protein